MHRTPQTRQAKLDLTVSLGLLTRQPGTVGGGWGVGTSDIHAKEMVEGIGIASPVIFILNKWLEGYRNLVVLILKKLLER